MDLVQLLAVHVGSKGEFTLHWVESCLQKLTSLAKGFLNDSFSVEIQEIKCKHADLDFDIFNLDILLFACHELLEGQYLLFVDIPSHSLTIQDEALGIRFDPSVKFGQDIGIFSGEIFRISGEDASNTSCHLLCRALTRFVQFLRCILGHIVNLCSFTIVLVLARKFLPLESIKNFSDGLGRLSQHGLQWYTRSELAVIS